MKDNLTIKDIGLEVIKWPITKVRVGKVDDRWLVEYRRKANGYLTVGGGLMMVSILTIVKQSLEHRL